MTKPVIYLALIAGLYAYMTWKPSTESIASGMDVASDQIRHDGHVYQSDWGKRTESIKGDVRRIDRHYDEHVPIITYNVVITTGEYSDPEIVTVNHKGGGNYYWSSPKQPKGSIIFYHTIPADVYAQTELDSLTEGDAVTIRAKVSQNSEITSDSGAFVKLMHNNHKIILVESAQVSGE